jgi:hypothetical protein
VPALVALAGGWLAQCRRPIFFWVDPDYSYLLNALTIAEWAPPKLIQHPGTVAQSLGAILLRVTHALAPGGHPSLREHVLTDPEPFLSLWRAVMLAMCVVVLAAWGQVLVRITGSIVESLLFQLMPLLSLETLFSLSRVQPEPLLLCLGIPMAAALVGLALDPARWDRPRSAVVLGVLAGLAMATKVTLLPLAVIPLVTMTRRSTFVKAALVAFFAGFAPALPETGVALRWFWGILTHTGFYGGGDAGIVDLSAYPSNVWGLVRAEWVASLIAFLGLGLALAISRRRDRSATEYSSARMLMACSVSHVAWLIISGKHGHPRYLLPLVLLASVGIVLEWRLSLSVRAGGAIRAVLAAIVLLALAGQPRTVAARVEEIREETRRRQTAASLAAAEGERIILATPVISIPGAMQYGHAYAGDRFRADLRRLYPTVTFWDNLGLNAFGAPAAPARVMTPLPGGGASFRLMGIEGYPVVQQTPAGVVLTKRVALGRHSLFDGRIAPCAGASPGPYGGYFDSFGLEWVAGPPPTLTGVRPRTRLLFTGNERPMTLEFHASREGEADVRVRISINGQKVGAHVVPLSADDGSVTRVRFDPRPGVNEVEIEYRPALPAEAGAPAVRFQRLRLVCDG